MAQTRGCRAARRRDNFSWRHERAIRALTAYALELDRRVEKELKALPSDIQRRVFSAFVKLRKDPTSVSSKKLVGEESYRIRVGDYRIVYDVDAAEQRATILKVAHRKDVYRR